MKPERQPLSWDVISEITARYGLILARPHTIASGYRNSCYSFQTEDGQMLNFLLYKAEPGIVSRIRRTNQLGAFGYAHGLPLRRPADARIIRVGRQYGSLYHYLDGDTIPWEAYTMKHIKLLGWVMGDMHAAFRGYDAMLPSVIDEYEQISKRVNTYFGRPGVSRALHDKLHLGFVSKTISDLLSLIAFSRGLPAQALHMDFVRGNILFATDSMAPHYTIGNLSLTGVLDLEKAAHGPVLYDIARTLAFLYVDCANKTSDQIRKYFLVSGYDKRSTASFTPSTANLTLLEQFVTLFLVYDFYKFLRDNPYEDLARNHHFCRTRDILIARKVLQYNN